MNLVKLAITTFIVLMLLSCNQDQSNLVIDKEVTQQSFQNHAPTSHHSIALEVIEASKSWITSFNKGDVDACVNGYASSAIMKATPFGLKNGLSEISGFWGPFIKSGATNLVYTNVSLEIINDTTAFLSANWSMNVGRGIIYQEKWEKKNKNWVLTYDDFEVLEQFESPKANSTNPLASHIALEGVIKASIQWINGFNAQNYEVCGNGYIEDATMNAIPFANLSNKKDIKEFWKKLIADGARNLIYHRPIFKEVTSNRAILSSNWSMNIGEGKIYQEKWILEGGEWLLDYDEFQVLKQY